MSATALPAHDSLLPRPPGGNGPGAALALLAHAGLILALTTVVDWRTRNPEAVSAELWAAVPQVAAPPPPAPAVTPQPPAPSARAEPPPPREADIALERARERKAEQDRLRAEEAAKAEKAAAAERQRLAQQKADDQKKQLEESKRQEAERKESERRKAADAQKKEHERAAQDAKAEEVRAVQQREANLRRMMGQAGGTAGSTGSAAQSAGPSGTYAAKLIGAIRRNIVFTGNPPGNPVATVEVTAAPGGSIISRRLVKSSGVKDWDEAVLRAVERTASLPRDTDGRVPSPVTIDFSFRD